MKFEISLGVLKMGFKKHASHENVSLPSNHKKGIFPPL